MARGERVEEVWAALEEFHSYAVSNYGRLLHIRIDRLLVEHVDSYGYSIVNLWRDRANYRRVVHHLVASAFLSSYDPSSKIYHADGNKQNNFIENLRYSRTHHSSTLVRNLTPPTQLALIEIVETGETFSSFRVLAERVGLDVSTIYKVLNGHRTHHRGMTFRRL